MLHVFYCFLADTMMKFASFETIVEMIYKYSIPVPKDQCSKSLQLGVSFAGGYVAGVFCAIVSHPADNLVSFLNNDKGATVGDVSTFSDSEFPEKHYFPPLNDFETLFMFGFAGCEEARCVGSVHSWAASPYCHDWNTYRSSVGNL
jgi:hypothetical protein